MSAAPCVALAGAAVPLPQLPLLSTQPRQGVCIHSATTYLRPETAQGAYVQFANVRTTSRKQLPFGIVVVVVGSLYGGGT